MAKEKTYIQVSTEVRDKLKGKKLVDRESYDEVLKRILGIK